MNTFVFQPGSTWRKLGYSYFSDSLAYREILNANPFWDISKLPAPGSVLYEPDLGSTSGAAGLSQAGITIDVNISTNSLLTGYYPFKSKTEYEAALSKYNPANLSNLDRINGWTSDSYQAQTGFQ